MINNRFQAPKRGRMTPPPELATDDELKVAQAVVAPDPEAVTDDPELRPQLVPLAVPQGYAVPVVEISEVRDPGAERSQSPGRLATTTLTVWDADVPLMLFGADPLRKSCTVKVPNVGGPPAGAYVRLAESENLALSDAGAFRLYAGDSVSLDYRAAVWVSVPAAAVGLTVTGLAVTDPQ